MTFQLHMKRNKITSILPYDTCTAGNNGRALIIGRLSVGMSTSQYHNNSILLNSSHAQ